MQELQKVQVNLGGGSVGVGVLRFEFVGDVPPVAKDSYPCSGVIFSNIAKPGKF